MSDVPRAASLYREVTADPISALPQLRRGVADPDELVRHVAAVQLAFHHPAELTGATTSELLETLLRVSEMSDTSPLTPEYAAATDDGENCWDLGQHIALALARLPVGSADFAVPKLVALWERDRQFYEAVLAAIALTFAEGDRPRASALSPPQRAVLAAMVEDEPVWDCCVATAQLLQARGLPSSRGGMQSFLGATGG